MTLVKVVESRVARSPQKSLFTFLADGEEIRDSVTFEDLWQRAASVASQLIEQTQAGDRVLLLYEPGIDYIVTFFACLMSGRIAVPVYPPNPRRLEQTLPRLLHIVADSSPAAVATSSMIRGLAEGLLTSMGVEGVAWCATDDGEDRPAIAPVPGIDSSSVAFLQYTSGSTSKPRGVRVTHGNLLANVELIAQALRADENTVGISWLPLYHDMGLIGKVITPAAIGCSSVLMSPLDYLRRPARWLSAITRFGGTVSAAPNFAYDLCVSKVTEEELAELDLSTWDVALNGAEPVSAETLKAFAERFGPVGFAKKAFLPAYGLAESTLIVTGAMSGTHAFTIDAKQLEKGRVVSDASSDGERRVLVSSGQVPGEGHLVRIVDPEKHTVVGDGQVGEIWVSGPSVADGYWERPDLTQQMFNARLADDDGRVYLRTGDLGSVLGDELFVTGRRKDLMILRGRNIYPQDVEATVQRAHEAVRPGGMAVFSVDTDDGEVAIVVAELERRTRAGKAGDDRRRMETLPEHEVAVRPEVDDVAEAIRSIVASEHRIDLACVVLIKPGSVPKTSSGKIQRHECRRQFLAGELDEFGRSDRAAAADGDIPSEMPTISVRELSYLPREQRVEVLRRYLVDLVAFVVGAGVSRVETAPLMSVGLDSLRAMEVQYTLEETLGIRLFPSLLLGGATVSEVAEELAHADFGAAEAAVGLADISSEVFTEPSEGQLTEMIRFDIEGSFDGHAVVDERLGFVEDDRPWGPTPTMEFHIDENDDNSLSWNERGFWLYQTAYPKSWAPNLYYAGELPEGTELEAVREIAQRIVNRHENLRARYVTFRGEPRRLTEDSMPVVLDEVDAGDWEDEELAREFERRAARPFDLERGPVIRFAFFHRNDRPVLFMTMHHIAADFWSLERLINEFADHVAGKEVDEPRITYSDFVTWQQKLIRSKRGKWCEEFWREQLATGLPKLRVPPSRKNAKDVAGYGRPFREKLSGDLVARIDQTANQYNVTRYTFLLSVYQVLLHRWSAQSEFMVGAVAAGRTRRFFRDVLGMFANPLPIRTKLSPATRFLDHLSTTQTALIRAMDAQEYPLQAMLERFELRRDGMENPIIQTLFASEQPREGSLEIGAAVGGLTTVDLGLGGTVFDFTVMVYQDADGGEVRVQYNDAKYDEDFAASFAASFRSLIAAFVDDPSRPIGSVDVLPEEEDGRILEWARGRELEVPQLTVQRYLEQRVQAHPERVAISGSVRWTYAELNARANRLAHKLIQSGVRPGTMVGVEVERSPALIAALYGVLKAGGTYVALQPSLPQRRVQYMADDSELEFTLTDALGRWDIGGARIDIVVMDDESLPAENPAVDVTPEHLAYVLYTSGTTGQPKGVMLPHEALTNLLGVIGEEFPVDENDVILQKTPYSFDISVSEIFNPLSHGAQLVMPGAGAERSPRLLRDAIEENGVTVLRMTPTELASLLGVEGAERCRSVRRVLACGEALTPAVRDRFLQTWGRHALLVNLWGPTEACVYASRWDCGVRDVPERVPIGRALPNYVLYSVDETLGHRTVNAQGELYVGGPCLARGYHRKAAQTAARYLPDPFSEKRGERMYRSGDLVEWNDEGQLEFYGRVDDQVQLRGLRVELGEIESYLEQAPGVEHAAVRPVTAADGRVEALVGYVVAKAGAKLQPGTLRTHLEQFIEAAKIPGRFVELDEMPRTASGKIDRKRLPEASATLRSDERVAPRTVLEERIAAIWKKHLNLKEVGVNENFFELGGHSLLAVRIQYELSKLTGTEVRLDTLFDFPTIAGLAEYIEQGVGVVLDAVSRHEYGNEAPMSAGQRRMWLMQRLSPGTVAYNVPGAVRLRGGIDVEALRGALDEVVARHEILRTLFPSDTEEPIQRILTQPDRLPFEVHDVGGEPASEARAWDLVAEDIARPFDLDRELPFRVLLVRLAADDAILAFTFHHIALDEWTTGILLRDLEAFYARRIGKGANGANGHQDARTSEWRQAWEASYRGFDVRAQANPLLNTSGWTSSFDGRPYSDEEMRDWLDGTLAPLAALDLGRTLEIGCGTGMVLFKLAPHASEYVGVDFTSSSLQYIEAVRQAHGSDYDNVRLVQNAAHEIAEIEGAFDTIILNSVIQYFPDLEYLERVVRLAISRLAPGGRLFIGDVRDRRLAYAFHIAIQRHRADASTTRVELRERALRSLAQDEELLVDPGYWTSLARTSSRVGHLDLFVPRAKFATEMSRFRYSVLLHVGDEPRAEAPPEIWAWGRGGIPVGQLQEKLSEATGAFIVAGVPNRRVASLVGLQHWLHADDEPRPVASFDSVELELGVDPEALRDLGERAGFRVTVAPSDDRLGVCYDVIFEPHGTTAARRPLTPVTAVAANGVPFSPPVTWEPEYPFGDVRAQLWHQVVTGSARIAEEDVLVVDDPTTRELPIQYADYAIWQAEQLNGELYDRGLAFWKEHLDGVTRGIDWPMGKPPTQSADRPAGYLKFEWSELASERLRELARSAGTSLFVASYALFSAFLGRYTGQRDLVVGLPVTMRHRTELQDLVGFFVNTVPLRADISPEAAFQDWFFEAARRWESSRPHQWVPLDNIVQAVNAKRSGRRTPLLEVMFIHLPEHRLGGQFAGLEIERLDAQVPEAKTDLEVEIRDDGPQLTGFFKYDGGRFDEGSMAHMARQFGHFAEQCLTEPERPMGQHDLVGPEERAAALAQARGEETPLADFEPVYRMIDRAAARHPDGIALTAEDIQWTYAELERRSNRLANRLRELGVGPDVPVGVSAERSVQLIAALLGVMKAGGAYVALPPDLPQDRLGYMAENAGVGVIIADEAGQKLFAGSDATLLVLDEALSEGADGPVDVAITRDHLAYILYTSGTTGRPKGVEMRHGAVWNLVQNLHERGLFTSDDVVLGKTPYGFDVSVSEMFNALVAGSTLALTPSGAERDPRKLIEAIEQHGVTVVRAVPTTIALLAGEEGLADCRTLQRIICAGEALTRAVVQTVTSKVDVKMYNLLGATETCVDSTYWECRPKEDDGETAPVGGPLNNYQTYVLAPSLDPVPRGTDGILYVGGEALARGYRGMPAQTAASFVPDPHATAPGARMYRTGDLVRWEPATGMTYIGRSDHQLQVRGIRVELPEIEAHLEACELVKHAAVVPIDAKHGRAEALVAYFVPAGDEAPTAGQLREHLMGRIQTALIPGRFVQMEELPRGASGKVDRAALPGLSELAASNGPVRLESDTERTVARIWTEVLEIDAVDREANFFEVGGNSIAAVKVHRRLEREFNRQIELVELFEHTTVKSLAEFLSDDGTKKVESTAEAFPTRERRELPGRQRRGAELPRRERPRLQPESEEP